MLGTTELNQVSLDNFKSITIFKKHQYFRKSTLPQFANSEQMFDTWLSDTEKLTLSAYGTRRLFDALKKAMWATSKKYLENGAYLKNSTPTQIQHRCPRCIRFHAGGADTCKSRNMVSNIQSL